MSDRVDAVVVGAGVIGLATAAALVERGLSVLVVERNDGPGKEVSSRNSEVIHAGLYYPPGSLKARLCVEGNRMLYDYCRRRGVEARALGKLVVAVEQDELPELERIADRGQANGAPGLEMVDRGWVGRAEPSVRAFAALHSPSTGVVDSHGLIKALEGQIKDNDGLVAYRCEVVGIDRRDGVFVISARQGSSTGRIEARAVVNAAGLESDRVAAMAGVDRYGLRWCKGDYFSVSGPVGRSVSRLIYPVPSPRLTGLGIHVTLDLAGRMRLGPDTTYLDQRRPDFEVDPRKATHFGRAARRYLPALDSSMLQPDMAGIRPKLQGPDDPWCDFVIHEESDAGLPGLVNLVGVESPGLTAALAVGADVCNLLQAADRLS